MKKTENYKYLLRLYSQVDDYLADIPKRHEDLPEVIVSFCVVTEKLFKIRLHKENPILVYENAKIKEDEALISVIKENELNIETIRIKETLNRYSLMFNGEFSEGEMQVLVDLYKVRNHFIHGFKSDDDVLSDHENILKKMGTVWEKISTQAISIFGNDLIKANKPRKKYSEEELEEVLVEEVRTKIKTIGDEYGIFRTLPVHDISSFTYFDGEICPRCGSYGFSLNKSDDNIFEVATVRLYSPRIFFSDLYKCSRCNLELTRKEYEIAKKLKPKL